jgi:hypothetical protein
MIGSAKSALRGGPVMEIKKRDDLFGVDQQNTDCQKKNKKTT